MTDRNTAFVPDVSTSERIISEVRCHFVMQYTQDRPRKMPSITAIQDEWRGKYQEIRNQPLPADHVCWECGHAGSRLERAHILMRRLGGTDHPGNLWMQCRRCHDETEFMDVWYKVHRFADPFRDKNGTMWRALNAYENAFRFSDRSKPKGICKPFLKTDPIDQVSELDDECIMVVQAWMHQIDCQGNEYAKALLPALCDRFTDAAKTCKDIKGTLFDKTKPHTGAKP